MRILDALIGTLSGAFAGFVISVPVILMIELHMVGVGYNAMSAQSFARLALAFAYVGAFVGAALGAALWWPSETTLPPAGPGVEGER